MTATASAAKTAALVKLFLFGNEVGTRAFPHG